MSTLFGQEIRLCSCQDGQFPGWASPPWLAATALCQGFLKQHFLPKKIALEKNYLFFWISSDCCIFTRFLEILVCLFVCLLDCLFSVCWFLFGSCTAMRYFLWKPMDFQRSPQLPINCFQHETLAHDWNLAPTFYIHLPLVFIKTRTYQKLKSQLSSNCFKHETLTDDWNLAPFHLDFIGICHLSTYLVLLEFGTNAYFAPKIFISSFSFEEPYKNSNLAFV